MIINKKISIEFKINIFLHDTWILPLRVHWYSIDVLSFCRYHFKFEIIDLKYKLILKKLVHLSWHWKCIDYVRKYWFYLYKYLYMYIILHCDNKYNESNDFAKHGFSILIVGILAKKNYKQQKANRNRFHSSVLRVEASWHEGIVGLKCISKSSANNDVEPLNASYFHAIFPFPMTILSCFHTPTPYHSWYSQFICISFRTLHYSISSRVYCCLTRASDNNFAPNFEIRFVQ